MCFTLPETNSSPAPENGGPFPLEEKEIPSIGNHHF